MTDTHRCPFRGEENPSAPQLLMSAFMRVHRHHWHRHVSLGLRPHEFFLLQSIRRHCAEHRVGPRISDLSGRLMVKPPTITQQVSELERRGLVERRRDEGDRRSMRVELSAAGKAILEEDRATVLGLFERITEHLGPQRTETLVVLLEEAADYLENEE